jgi:hypothetical protein
LFSTDGASYTEVGKMQRVGGGWRYDGFTPPPGQPGYLRARAPAPAWATARVA